MELRTEKVYTEEKKGPATTQLTFDETYHLPDYLPDFFSVILSRGQIRMDETKCSQGHVQVQGTLQFRVLYRTGQNEWNICSLEGEIPFHEMMTLDEAKEFDMAQTEAILEDLTVRMINARKLNIRALVEIKVWARERLELNIPVAIDSEYPLEELHNTEVYLELCYRGTERWKLKEEVRLPSNKPNIRQLLWQQHQLLGREIRVNQGNVQVQGEIQIFLLYLGMEEDRLQWLEMRVPYQYELDVAEAESDMIPCVSGQEPVMICRVQEDADGEERMLLLEADTPVELRLYREVKREQLIDAYSLERQLQLQTKQVKFPQLHMKNSARCRVNDSIEIEKQEAEILQLGAGFGTVEAEHWEVTEQGIHVEGAVWVSILYLTSSDVAPVGAAEGLVPFQYDVEIPEMKSSYQIELQTGLAHLSFLMKSGTELEVQAVVDIETLITKEKQSELITGTEDREYDINWLNHIPGIAGIRLQKPDDLWNIAKKFHTTVQDIKTVNELSEEKKMEGMKLLIVKK